LYALYQEAENVDKIQHFVNRKPKYSTVIKEYILNFSGRIRASSSKNFILEDKTTKKEIVMFGKTGENDFRMDISSPITPFLAFCLNLANFDSKLICD
jgi:hypothetical protein